MLTLPETLAGFGDPAVVLIASLFVVSEGLDATGVTAWVGQMLVRKSGDSMTRLLILTMLLTATLTALIGLNGTIAALLPMAVVVSLRRAFPPSRLLMPMAFAGSAGGMLLLTGSPVNMVISEAALEAGVGELAFAEFALAGIPLVLGTVAIVLLLGERLLPSRTSSQLPPDMSRHAATLIRHYSLENVVHLRVSAESTLRGSPRDHWQLQDYPGVAVITVLDADSQRPVSTGVVESGDRITILGDPETARRYAADHGLGVETIRSAGDIEATLFDRDTGVAEVVVPPRSRFEGRTVQPGQLIDDDRLVVLAVQRQGRDRGPGPIELRVGDVLLVEGGWDPLAERAEGRDLLVVDSPELIRRQAVPLGRRSTAAVIVLAAMVVMLATGVVAPVLAAMLAAGAMILLRVVTPQQAYGGISWSTVLLVAGMIPMATAITVSGAGEMVAEILVSALGDAGPTVLLAALFGVTVIFSQLISNTATALVMIPIAVSAADQLGVSARPVLMCVCVAAAASYLTPVATPANMMVMGPGDYRFGDYWRLGLPLLVLSGVVAILLVPFIWAF